MGGILICGSPDTEIEGFVCNSNNVRCGNCFVAIKGKHYDGNSFIKEAEKKGAVAVLSDSKTSLETELLSGSSISLLLTDNVYNALGKAAKFHRENYIKNVIGVTGSVGKTTVKELIYSILSEKLDIFKTEGNKNNELGLPLTILSGNMSKNVVIELGISNFNEMEKLSGIAQPDVSVITNIGNMHIENFGTRENTAREKLKILTGMKENGTLVFNGDEKLLTDFPELPDNRVTVSEKNNECDIFVFNVRTSSAGTFFDVKINIKTEDQKTFRKKNDFKKYMDIFVPIIGNHGAFDAAFALAVGEIYGCSEEQIRRGLKKYKPCGDRQNIEYINGRCYIFDSYNAGPESFDAALNVLKITAEEKGIKYKAVLAGSMLELGNISKEEHIKLGKKIANNGADLLITVGEEGMYIAEGAVSAGMNKEKVSVFLNESDMEKIFEKLKNNLKKGAILLIKGSRGMHLERIREYITEDF